MVIHQVPARIRFVKNGCALGHQLTRDRSQSAPDRKVWRRNMALQLLEPFIVRPDRNARHNHWQGGPPVHAGATCARCGHPFQLFWDLNCCDPRFRNKNGRPIFRNLARLPLYWCVPCFLSIDYSVIDDKRIELLRVDGEPAHLVKRKRPNPRFPYANFPREFDRQAIELTSGPELPKTVRELFTAEPTPKLTPARQALLERFVGHAVYPRLFALTGSTWVHSFGGTPYLPQGDDWIVCPNERCRSFGKRMKVMAAIHNDPPNGLPLVDTMEKVQQSKSGMFNYFVVVFFHFCKSCKTVHAHSQGT